MRNFSRRELVDIQLSGAGTARALSCVGMFSNILCPIDFTSFSHRALAQAVGIARSFSATVTGVYVADRDCPSAADAWRRAWTTEELPDIQAQVLKKLQEMDAPSPRAVAVLGNPGLEIVKLAGALSADLIVMPSYGRSGQTEHACGSVTAYVLCHAPAPVLIVPDAHGTVASALTAGFDRIVCGINFSPASLKALRYAGELGSASCRLFVTHVMSVEDAAAISPRNADFSGSEDATTLWRRRLHEAAHIDVPRGVQVEDRLRIGDPAEEILRLAEEERADLIVIGGHRGNPSGCVMNAVASRSHCPVLTVRAPRLRAAAAPRQTSRRLVDN
jgi:nucleotide-binding universal stress UspA family protein